VVSGAPALATVATQASLPITAGQGTLAAANYTFNPIGGTLTIGFTATATASRSLCNGAHNRTFDGNLTVSAGQNCIFVNGAITGDVTQNGGNFELNQSKDGENVQVNGGVTFLIGPVSDIAGNLQITKIPAGSRR
jgi:hypothetical protein